MGFDVIIFAETFVEEKNYKKLQKSLPSCFDWRWTPAKRTLERGRASAGMLLGVNKTHLIEEDWSDKEDSITGVRIEAGGRKLNVIGIYNKTGVEKIRKKLEHRMETMKGENTIVMGDWNARIGDLGERNSRDKMINKEGSAFLEFMEEYGLEILNGRTDGDWEGQYTHIDYKSESVIDYAAASMSMAEFIHTFKVGTLTHSDHFPLEICCTKIDSAGTEPKEEWVVKPDYSKHGIEKYKENLAAVSDNLGDGWPNLHQRIWDSIPKKRVNNTKAPTDDWWTTECYLKRKEMEAMGAESREDGRKSRSFYKAKRRYKAECKKAKKQKAEQQLREIREITNINGAWKYINAKKGQGYKDLPEEEKLAEHFMNLLDGEELHVRNVPTPPQEQKNEDISITPEEFNRHLEKLKDGKAAGPDQLKAEALKNATTAMKEKLREVCERALRGEGIPDEWRDARIHPIHKKGDPSVPENYRGIAICCSPYKFYASIINTRLEEFVTANDILPDTQNGFRRERSGMNNIFILDQLVQRAVIKRKRLYAAFIDFKAAFDTIDRERLFRKLEKLKIPPYLIAAIRDIYAETRATVGKKSFRHSKGLRQGCPLSPLLFALYISDIDQVLANAQDGGVVLVRGVKIYVLAYADDLLIIAETPRDLKEMLLTMAKYADRRGLIINTDKCKVMRFAVGGKLSKEKWVLCGSVIEEVREFRYLGFTFYLTGSHERHIGEVASAARRAVARVWSIGERKFAENFMIRRQMFFSLILPILTYGCEVTGYTEWTTIEAQARKYFRWTLGLNQGTRNAIVMDEVKIEPIVITTGMRALRFEQKALSGPCELLRRCVLDNERADRKEAKRRFCEKGGLPLEAVNERMRNGADLYALRDRHEQVFQQQQFVAIAPLRYALIRPQTLPLYLTRSKDIKIVARFRCENEERGRESWRADKRCRVCGAAEETLEHMRKDCLPQIGVVRGLLSTSGRGADKMNLILNCRRRRP